MPWKECSVMDERLRFVAGIIARNIGTAPRRPTHEMKAISGAVYRAPSTWRA
jgi:hypothetical protein